MDRSEMLRLFEAHREAEAARDIDAILETFVEDCFLETMALGIRSEGKEAVRAAYEMQFFSAFPDLEPEDEGMAFADVVPFRDGLMAGELIYFDLATLCEQARIPLDEVRNAAASRRVGSASVSAE
jgi:hypothetical protein